MQKRISIGAGVLLLAALILSISIEWHSIVNLNEKVAELEKKNEDLIKENQSLDEKLRQIQIQLLEQIAQLENWHNMLVAEYQKQVREFSQNLDQIENDFENYKVRYANLYEKADYLVHLNVQALVGFRIDDTLYIQDAEANLSGFVIKVEDQPYIVTAAHIQLKDPRYEITIKKIVATIKYDLSEQEVEILGHDNDLDVAVLKFKDTDYKYVGQAAKLGDSDNVRIGEPVAALGSPLSIPFSITAGILGNKIEAEGVKGNKYYLLMHQATINPGNSGGPLLNDDGEVVGVNVMVFGSGGNNFVTPIPVAVSVNDLKAVLSDLVKGVKR